MYTQNLMMLNDQKRLDLS